jgi:hypothetical protein
MCGGLHLYLRGEYFCFEEEIQVTAVVSVPMKPSWLILQLLFNTALHSNGMHQLHALLNFGVSSYCVVRCITRVVIRSS